MRRSITRWPALLLLPVLMLIGGCEDREQDTAPKGIDFLVQMELMGAPSDAGSINPLGSGIVEMKLGKEVRKSVEFPDRMQIQFKLTDIPEGARFTCAVGMKNFVNANPNTRFRFARTAPTGVETELETIQVVAGTDEAWHPVSIDLSDYIGQEIRLTVSAVANRRVGKVYLANPRLVVPSIEDPTRVVVICIDTLRADHLGVYGCERPLTPGLDAFAEESVRFENCETASPWTLPSVAATITGRYPSQIAADSISEHLRSEETTLAELFFDKDFRTASMTNNRYVSAEVGFFQGVEYQHESPRAPADEQYATSLEWIGNHMEDDFYLYIHLFDPHLPYDPPEPFLSQFSRGSGRFPEVFSEVTEYRAGTLILTDEEKEQIHGLYDGSVAFADQETGRFFDELKSMGIWDDMAVVVFSDHGEEFWEHGGFEHGHSVYEEVSHVPLLVKLPGHEPAVESLRVSLIDIMPTLIEWADLDTPDGLMGRDLFDPPSPDDPPRRFFIEECIHATESMACIQEEWKQIVHFDGLTGPELYYLVDDPSERTNLVSMETDRAEALTGEIVIYSAQTSEGCHFRLYPTEDAPNGVFTVIATAHDAVFTNPCATSTGTIESEDIQDSEIRYDAQFRRGGFFGMDFLVEPESAEVTFTVSFNPNPGIEFPWYLGASDLSFTGNEHTVSMVDPSIAMAYPQARLSTSEGVYIWSVPPSVRDELQNSLSPETIEELVSLGYISR